MKLYSTIMKAFRLLFPGILIMFAVSCSFDYGQQNSGDSNLPDIVMNNVEYVRVRSADPVVRFQAAQAERYEKRRIMDLQNFSFEQFGNHGEEVNAYGRAGSASVEMDSGNIRLDNGVRVEVDSEEITIETKKLEWKDKERILTGGVAEEVNIFQDNGTLFTGIGFRADARQRTWEFSEGVKGSYVHQDKDEQEPAEAESAESGEKTNGAAAE